MDDVKATNVWLGSELGILKAVNLVKKLARNHFDKDSYGKEVEILSMCLDKNEPTKLYTGHKSGIVRTFDIDAGQYDSTCLQFPKNNNSTDHLVKVNRVGANFATCTTMGKFCIWKPEGDAIDIMSEVEVGNEVFDMAANDENPNIFAVGGKENPLKIYDVENSKKPTFTAKNVPHDWLQLRVPVWVTGIKFLKDCKRIVTCTGTSKIRLYDPSSNQRRPCVEINFDEYPLTAVTVTNNDQVIVGNTRGNMGLFDLRKKAMVHAFKGFAGSIRALHCHPTLDYVASCGVDRFLRIHNIKTSALEHKVYLKSRLSCLRFSGLDFVADLKRFQDEQEAEESLKRGLEEEEEEEVTDSEEEELWGNMKNAEVDDNEAETNEGMDNEKTKKKRKNRSKKSSKKMKK